MILLIDNYDSFSYNLFQQAAAIEPDMRVVRNDALTVSEIEGLNPSHIILSPGPGYPKDAGICEEVVSRLGGSIPILGVCLGHQAICEAFGGRIEHAQQLMHGQAEHRRGGYRRAAVQGSGKKDHGSALSFSGRCTGFSAGVPQGHFP